MQKQQQHKSALKNSQDKNKPILNKNNQLKSKKDDLSFRELRYLMENPKDIIY